MLMYACECGLPSHAITLALRILYAQPCDCNLVGNLINTDVVLTWHGMATR